MDRDRLTFIPADRLGHKDKRQAGSLNGYRLPGVNKPGGQDLGRQGIVGAGPKEFTKGAG